MTKEDSAVYTPPLGHAALTPIYDAAIALLTREMFGGRRSSRKSSRATTSRSSISVLEPEVLRFCFIRRRRTPFMSVLIQTKTRFGSRGIRRRIQVAQHHSW